MLELFGCDSRVLQDQKMLEGILQKAAMAADTKIVQSVFHKFSPQGVTGVVVIEESHLSLHTWPEYGYASVDFFTCGKGQPNNAYKIIVKELEADRHELLIVERGLSLTDTSMRIRSHNKVSSS